MNERQGDGSGFKRYGGKAVLLVVMGISVLLTAIVAVQVFFSDRTGVRAPTLTSPDGASRATHS